MIRFTCKQCGKQHARPDESAGSLVFCECGQANRVPWESRGPEQGPEAPQRPRPAASPSQEVPRLRARDPSRCLNHEEAPAEQKCLACGEAFCASCVVTLQGRILCGPCKDFGLAQEARPPQVSGLAVVALLLGAASGPVAFVVSVIPYGQPGGPTSGAAVFGAVGMVLPLAGLVLGLLALWQIESDPRVGGRALAMTGTATAGLGLLWCLAMVLIQLGRQLLE